LNHKAGRTNNALLLLLLIAVAHVQAGAFPGAGGRMTSLATDKQGHVVETVSEMEKGAIQKGMLEGGASTSLLGSRRLMMMDGGMSMSSSSSSGSKNSYNNGGWYSGQYSAADNSKKAADEKKHPPMARNLAVGGVGVALVVLATIAAWMEKRVSHSFLFVDGSYDFAWKDISSISASILTREWLSVSFYTISEETRGSQGRRGIGKLE
jgi:hypothetical protein